MSIGEGAPTESWQRLSPDMQGMLEEHATMPDSTLSEPLRRAIAAERMHREGSASQGDQLPPENTNPSA